MFPKMIMYKIFFVWYNRSKSAENHIHIKNCQLMETCCLTVVILMVCQIYVYNEKKKNIYMDTHLSGVLNLSQWYSPLV